MPVKSCPICGKQPTDIFTPFCSRRCSDIDLLRWFNGGYSAPALEQDELPDELDVHDDTQH